MKLEDVVCRRETDMQKDHSRRLVAAVITQAFFYMVQAGLNMAMFVRAKQLFSLEYLRISDSVSFSSHNHKVTWGSRWDGYRNCMEKNQLHLTALGKVLAFTLQALQTLPRR